MYYTGLDPRTLEPVTVAKKMRDRRFQRALLQFFKPENYFEVRQALRAAGRADLIGDGCDALIPASPLRQALEARRQRANQEARGGEYVHQIPREQPGPPGPRGAAIDPTAKRTAVGSGRGQRPSRGTGGRRRPGLALRCCAPQSDSRGGYWVTGIMSCRALRSA